MKTLAFFLFVLAMAFCQRNEVANINTANADARSYEYLGCWSNLGPETNFTSHEVGDLLPCFDICREEQKPVAAIGAYEAVRSYHDPIVKCHCLNTEGLPDLRVAESACDFPCPAHHDRICGGYHRYERRTTSFSVFRINSTTSVEDKASITYSKLNSFVNDLDGVHRIQEMEAELAEKEVRLQEILNEINDVKLSREMEERFLQAEIGKLDACSPARGTDQEWLQKAGKLNRSLLRQKVDAVRSRDEELTSLSIAKMKKEKDIEFLKKAIHDQKRRTETRIFGFFGECDEI